MEKKSIFNFLSKELLEDPIFGFETVLFLCKETVKSGIMTLKLNLE